MTINIHKNKQHCPQRFAGDETTHTSKKGFIFLEAMMSVSILAILLTPMLIMQNTVINRVIKDKDFAQRTGFMQNLFYFTAMNPDQEKQKSFDKSYNDPEFKIEYLEEALTENSSLKRFKGMNKQTVKATWDRWSGQQNLVFTQLQFGPESEQKDE